MKYILFAYYVVEPYGGWEDFKGLFNSIPEAEEAFNYWNRYNNYEGQIVNATSLQVEKEL